MANENYNRGKITIQQTDRWIEIDEWNLYKEEKKAIQDKYPTKPWYRDELGKGNYKEPFDKEWWDEWQEYKKEITDLLLEPNGNFSKFLYEIRPERGEAEVRVWMRGRYNTDTYMKTRNKHKNK